jgi:glycosyltransferase involved in cell wall biosynthesis
VTAAAVLLEQCLGPVPGGTGRYARELAGALARRARRGATVTGWTAWHRDVSPAHVDGVAGPRRLFAPAPVLYRGYPRGLGPGPRHADVVHAPTLLMPPRRRTPVVVTIHDAVPWTHPETLTRRGVAWHRAMARRAARYADLVVAPTQAVADDLERLLHLRGRLLVVGEGVAADLAPPPDAEARARRLELPERFLLSLATLEPRKGLDVALAALADPAAPDLPLLIVGQPGWGGVDPEAEALRVGLPPGRVRVLGRLGDADLAVALSRALALVAPSRAEGFGLPVLEAMAAGTPVVVSAVPALVEVAGDAALVVPVGDPKALAEACAAYAGDESLRSRHAAAGRTRAAAYSWDGAADAMWAAYASVGA